ncbi:CHAT domain-containing protein [Vibrio sp. SCSIO 43136]|uniref:CHAT domain-containing protein n=1 Tax=Vibrio sp. SCSIO 43136 TaxID=2819101 RepID=UPI0020755D88|nr:CHAT domain-containing protein [Vibrio sp. SCSIO 43136]USD66892.1 CHAT domain-containing protein [Vibrio sp. SCSIO 43136]
MFDWLRSLLSGLVFVLLSLTSVQAQWLDDLYYGDVESAEKAVLAGADVNAYDSQSETYPIFIALYSNNTDALEMLHYHGARLVQEDDYGRTVMLAALEKGDLLAARVLQKMGAPLEPSASTGATPFHYGVLSGRADIVEWLISEEMDVNQAANNGWNVIDSIFALEYDEVDLDVGELLHLAGLSAKTRSQDGYSLLDWALDYQNDDLALKLMVQGYSPFEVVEGLSQIDWALMSEPKVANAILELLLEELQNPNTTENPEYLRFQILRYSARLNRPDLFEQQFSTLFVEIHDAFETTLLQIATAYGSEKIMGKLIENNASIEAESQQLASSLMLAFEDPELTDSFAHMVIKAQRKENFLPLATAAIEYDQPKIFYQALPLLDAEQVNSLDLDIFYYEEEKLGEWVSSALAQPDKQQALSLLLPYFSDIEDDRLFIDVLGHVDFSVLNASQHNDLLSRLLFVEAEGYTEKELTIYQASVDALTKDLGQKLSVDEIESLVENLLYSANYPVIIELLKSYQPENADEWLVTLLEEKPTESQQAVYDQLANQLVEIGAQLVSSDPDQISPIVMGLGYVSETTWQSWATEVDFNQLSEKESASLIRVAIEKESQAVSALVEAQNLKYQSSWNALLWRAVEKQQYAFAYQLWSQGAYNETLDSFGLPFVTHIYQTPSDVAFEQWVEASPVALERLVFAKDYQEKSLLSHLLEKEDTASFQMLIDKGLKLSAAVVAEIATSSSASMALEYLPKLAAEDRPVLLQKAVTANNLELVTALLKQGVDPHFKNEQRRDAFDLAADQGHTQIMAVLDQHFKLPQAQWVSNELYDDPLIRYWSWLNNFGEPQKLINSIESNLLSGKPHPFARYVWLEVHENHRLLPEKIEQVDSQLATAMGDSFEAEFLATHGKLAQAAQAYKSITPSLQDLWLINAVARYYIDHRRLEEGWQILEQGLLLAPNFWQLSWNYYDSDWAASEVFSERLKALLANEQLQNTLVAEMGAQVLADKAVNEVNLRVLKHKWLDETYDSRLATSLGYFYAGRSFHQQALEHFQLGVSSFPFYSNIGQVHKRLAVLGRDEQLEGSTALRARWYNNDFDAWDLRAKRYAATAYRQSGDKGRAYDIYEALDAPDSVLLALNKAILFKADDHHTKVVRTLDPFLTSGELGDYEWRIYIQSLSSIGETSLAIKALQIALEEQEHPTVWTYLEGIKLYKKADMPQQASKLLETAMGLFPNHVSLAQEYANELIRNHQADKAVEHLEQLAKLYPTNNTLLKSLYNAVKAQQNASAAQRYLFELGKQQLWNNTLWELVAEKASDKSNVWLAQLEIEPSNFNANLNMLEIAAFDDDYRAAWDWLDKAALGVKSPSEKNDWVWNKTWLLTRQAQRYKLPSEELQKHLEDWHSYRDGFGYLSTYYRSAADIYYAMDDFANAAKQIQNYSDINPDNTNVLQILVQNYRDHLPNTAAYRYGYEMIRRDPYNGDKVNALASDALYWGTGTAAIALKLLNDARSRGVVVSKKLEQKALSDLGDHLAGFLSYRYDSAISSSLRYVGWFDSMRKEALAGEGNIVRQRDNNGLAEVEIVLPNGEVYIQRDDPIIGKPVYMSRGASFLEIGYDLRGNLASINNANGDSVELNYDLNNSITSMKTPTTEMLFRYNALNKPVEITLVGMGTLRVEYDEEGEITRTFSEEGHKMALRITQSFQSLLSLAKSTQTARQEFKLPKLDYRDDKIEVLESRHQDALYADGPERHQAILDTGVELASHLATNLGNYSSDLIAMSFDMYQSYHADPQWRAQVAQFVKFWMETQNKTRPLGLVEEELSTAQSMRLWLSQNQQDESVQSVIEQTSHLAFREIQEQSWRHNSIVSNTGYWYRNALPKIEGLKLDGSKISSVLALDNGDVWVGTEDGLMLKRNNFWSWFNYDGVSRKLVRSGDKPDTALRMNVRNIVQADSGAVYLATQGGLFVVDTQDNVVRWNGLEDDLASENVAYVESYQDHVWLAVGQQLLEIDETNRTTAVKADLTYGVDQFKRLDDQHWVILSGENLHLVNAKGESSQIASGVQYFMWHAYEGTLWWWDGKILQSRYFDYGVFDDAQVIADASTMPMSQRMVGFTELYLPELGYVPAVLSDTGLGIWHKQRFHLIELPYEEMRGGLSVGPLAAASSSRGDWTILTQEGVYDFAPSRSSRFEGLGKTSDLLYIKEFGATFAATGGDIMAFFEDESEVEPIRFSGVNARILRRNSNGDLITHDGRTVVKIAVGTSDTVELFKATSDHENRPIEDIFVDTDDSIWVVAGADLFHWKQGELEHFNYYIDPKRFPSRSNMLAKVFRDLQGDLYVVASNEGHLDHQGVYLTGGLLRLGELGFERVKRSEKPNWFALGYTPISEDKAIVSTGGSFLLDNNGKWRSYRTMGDKSYQEMSDRSQMLFLGREGVKLGEDDAWLFPSAAGVVMYQSSGWLYPDRLNQLLIKDQSFGQYGARVVHSVSVDGRGRVFVATDLGVTLYNAGGLASLLSDHNMGTQAFLATNTEIQNEISTLFLDNIPKNSEQGKLIAKYRSVEDDLERLEAELESQSARENTGFTEPSADDKPSKTSKQLQKELKRKERTRQRLLANLERDHTALYQMLRVDPREISALNDKLTSDQVLVQFIPTPDKLLTQVVSKEGANVFEVSVNQTELSSHIANVSYGLRKQALKLHVDIEGAPFEQVRGFIKSGPSGSKEEMMQSLTWLYDKLLRPIEGHLDGKKEVYITPAGTLNYVPFAALIRNSEPSLEYAIERYPLGILPSLYHFNLIAGGEESLNEMALFVSDPDGSLPGARQEVEAIENIYSDDSVVLEGEEASIEELENHALDSQVIHFATHGILDSEDPADSFLLMADNQRLGVIDISMMDLQETDLVVLSACESGIGVKGLEYASMARAFAHAKVPTVVASYWQVNDAATSELMRIFYNELKRPNQNTFTALANAQRAMIAKQGDLSDPAAWSSFAVFGKP